MVSEPVLLEELDVSMNDLHRSLDDLDVVVYQLRQAPTGAAADQARTDLMKVLRLFKVFYDAPGHRLQMEGASRAAKSVGYSREDLARFSGGPNDALRLDGDGYALTSGGQQWFERQFAYLMSRTE